MKSINEFDNFDAENYIRIAKLRMAGKDVVKEETFEKSFDNNTIQKAVADVFGSDDEEQYDPITNVSVEEPQKQTQKRSRRLKKGVDSPTKVKRQKVTETSDEPVIKEAVEDPPSSPSKLKRHCKEESKLSSQISIKQESQNNTEESKTNKPAQISEVYFSVNLDDTVNAEPIQVKSEVPAVNIQNDQSPELSDSEDEYLLKNVSGITRAS